MNYFHNVSPAYIYLRFFLFQIMKADRYLAPHYAYYVREIKVSSFSVYVLLLCELEYRSSHNQIDFLCCVFLFFSLIKFR